MHGKMPPKPSWFCPQHAAWGHADVSANLRIATEKIIQWGDRPAPLPSMM